MNMRQEFWFNGIVASMQDDLHDRGYTVGYSKDASKDVAEAVLDDAKQEHRRARTLDPSIPDFDNRTFRRPLTEALNTPGAAEEFYAQLDALAWRAP
jgi:hypothetical protein